MSDPACATDAHDRLMGAVKELVLSLRLTAEDLSQAEPTDLNELEGKLLCLQETVLDGVMAVSQAADLYDQVPAEPEPLDPIPDDDIPF